MLPSEVFRTLKGLESHLGPHSLEDSRASWPPLAKSHLELLTLSFDSSRGCFDEAPLESLQETHEIVELHDHFFELEGDPYWALLVRCREKAPRSEARSRERTRNDAPTELLTDEEKLRYQAVRRWRNEWAKRVGKPPYVLLTNRQTAELVRSDPATLAALRQVDGMGEGRLEEFGAELLVLLSSLREPIVATTSVFVPRSHGDARCRTFTDFRPVHTLTMVLEPALARASRRHCAPPTLVAISLATLGVAMNLMQYPTSDLSQSPTHSETACAASPSPSSSCFSPSPRSPPPKNPRSRT